MDFLGKAWSQVVELFRSLTPVARLAAGLLLVLVGISLTYLFGHRGSRADTYLLDGQPLAPSQITLMEAAFAKANLSTYEVQGSRVRVPQSQHPAYIAALADAGAMPPEFGDYLKNSLEKPAFLEDRKQREERIKSALQRELQSIIRSMHGIETASVLYNVPQPHPFGQEQAITASVSVKPMGAKPLEADRVPAIRQLVASAIGAKPENVTVTDLNGRTQPGTSVTEASGRPDDAYRTRKRLYEKDWQSKISSALAFIPGVVVTANVELAARSDIDERAAKADAPVPNRVTVSVGVPSSYYDKVWSEQNPAADRRPSRKTRNEALAEIETRVKGDVEKAVLALLPAPLPNEEAASRVSVTTFADIIEPSAVPSFAQQALGWLNLHWTTLGMLALAGFSLVLVRSMVRLSPANPSSASGESPSVSLIVGDDSRQAEASPRRSPAQGRRAGAALHDELDSQIRHDPQAAANVLKAWVGDAS